MSTLCGNSDEFSEHKLISDGQNNSGDVFCCQWVHIWFYMSKKRRTIQWEVIKPASVMVCGCIRANGMGDLYSCERTIDSKEHTGIFQRHRLQSKLLFQQVKAGLHSADLQQHVFIHTECVCLTRLPAVHVCLLLEMHGASWRGESDNNNQALLSS